jgi:hypothetical protein
MTDLDTIPSVTEAPTEAPAAVTSAPPARSATRGARRRIGLQVATLGLATGVVALGAGVVAVGVGPALSVVTEATNPYPGSATARELTAACNPVDFGGATGEADVSRCEALRTAATGAWLASKPAPWGSCPLATERDCRASLGLRQTPQSAGWRKWEVPGFAARMTVYGTATVGIVAAFFGLIVRPSCRQEATT